MKTKHILTALALPAMFAACTADDIVSVDNGLQQDARAKLSKDFVLNTNGEVDSRYAVVGTTNLDFKYEEGDMIGANLIDVYNPEYKDEPEKWDITPYVAPSLPFKNIGGNQWKSDAELGVGNYLFTYPFNPKDNGRAAAQFELPRVQQYNGEDLNALIQANNKSVGAVVLTEGKTEANVALKNLYTYPKFVLNFDNGEKIKEVTKVVLKYNTPVVYKGGFNHAKIVDMFNADVIANWKKLPANKGKDEKAYWAEKTTYDFIIDENDAIDPVFGDLTAYGKPETTDYLIVEMGEAVKLESNTSNKYIEVRLMMPSVEKFDNNTGITLYAVTDNGTYGVDLIENSCLFKATTSAETIEQALWRSKSNTLNINPKAWEITNDLGNIVTTAEDWNNLVSVYGDSKKYAAVGGSEDFKVSVLSNDFALTKDLKMPKVAEFIIETPISVEGEVALQNVNVNNTVTVEKGATLTTSATFVANKVEVEKGGNLVFAAELDEDDEVVAYDGVANVCNHGIVTVPAGVEATFILTNKKDGVLNVEAAASRAAEEAGVANINADNHGKIVNNGIINVNNISWSNDFRNNEPSTTEGYEYDEEEGWDGYPTVENNGVFNLKGHTDNKGLFINKGTLSSNFTSDGTFGNLGTLQVKAGATTFIDSNAGGVIELEEKAPANFTIFDAKEVTEYEDSDRGTIKYKVSGKSTKINLADSPVNYLVVDGGLELEASYTYTVGSSTTVKALTTVEMLNGGEVKLVATKNAANNYIAQIGTLKITEGIAKISGEIAKEQISAIQIAEEAELQIPAGAKLTVSSYSTIAGASDESKGALQVNGTLVVASETGAVGTGLIDKATAISKNSMISVGKQGSVYGNAGTAAYENTALDNAVIAWYSAAKRLESSMLRGGYFGFNPYDVKAFAKFLYEGGAYNGGSGWSEKTVIVKLVGEDGWNLIEPSLDDIEEKLLSIYSTATTGFAAAVTRNIVGAAPTGDALKTLKALYINNKSELISEVGVVDDLYYTKDMAIRDLATKLAGATNMEAFEETKAIFTITSDIATALNNTNEYAYIWAEETCPLYHVASVAKKYSLADWETAWGIDVFLKADEFDNLETVQNWIKYADMKGGTTEATVAANYVETSKEWEYSDEQVKAAFGATKVVIKVVTPAP